VLTLGLSLTAAAVFASDPAFFADDFAGGALNSFWATTTQNGALVYELPSWSPADPLEIREFP
jgi:hypothetical protein